MYKPTRHVCYICMSTRHRSDVCPTPDAKKCSICGIENPIEDHSCQPKCSLCGEGHMTGARECKLKLRKARIPPGNQNRKSGNKNEEPDQDGSAPNGPCSKTHRGPREPGTAASQDNQSPASKRNPRRSRKTRTDKYAAGNHPRTKRTAQNRPNRRTPRRHLNCKERQWTQHPGQPPRQEERTRAAGANPRNVSRGELV